VEVLVGLKGDENLIVNPPDSIVSGQQVRLASNAEPTKGAQP
jgi:hypothetical protein